MDIISYSKASQTLKGAKKYDAMTVAPGAENRFETVDERIDYLENKLVGRYEDKVVEIDLSKGNFINTTLNQEKGIELKKIGEGIGNTIKKVPISTGLEEGSIKSAVEITSKENYSIKSITDGSGNSSSLLNYLFDNNWSSSTRYIIRGNGGFSIDFKVPKIITSIWLITVISEIYTPISFKVFGLKNNIEKEIASFENIGNLKEGKLFEFENYEPFNEYSVKITKFNTNYNSSEITECSLYEREITNYYASKGTWESNVIDLGGEWIETKYLKFTQDVAESHSVTKEISYSDDGITFSDYALYDAELVGQHRFIKVRLELISTDEISDTTNYSYEAEGNKDFTFNKDSVIQTDRIVLNTNKKVNATSIKEGYYETDLTGFNRISKVKEVF